MKRVVWDPNERWAFNMERVLLFIEKLKATPAVHGEVWKAKMMEYYRTRLVALLADAPYECRDLARIYRGRMHRVYHQD